MNILFAFENLISHYSFLKLQAPVVGACVTIGWWADGLPHAKGGRAV